MDFVLTDFVTKQPPGGTVMFHRHRQPPGNVAQSRDHDERNGSFALPPADAADLVVGDEGRIGPDPVLIEAAADPTAQGHEVAEVQKHHRLAECLSMRNEHLEQHQRGEYHSQSNRQTVVGWLGARPDEQRVLLAALKANELDDHAGVGDEESGAQEEEHSARLVHGSDLTPRCGTPLTAASPAAAVAEGPKRPRAASQAPCEGRRSQALDWYSPVSVLTRILSPSLTN